MRFFHVKIKSIFIWLFLAAAFDFSFSVRLQQTTLYKKKYKIPVLFANYLF